jgi:hypothetical protein
MDLIDEQGDTAFDAMDAVLDKAQWSKGQVVLHIKRNAVYCYDLNGLKRELQALGTAAVLIKHNTCVANFEEVFEDLFEEYQRELRNVGFVVKHLSSKKPKASGSIKNKRI